MAQSVGLQLNFLFKGLQDQLDELKAKVGNLDGHSEAAQNERNRLAHAVSTIAYLKSQREHDKSEYARQLQDVEMRFVNLLERHSEQTNKELQNLAEMIHRSSRDYVVWQEDFSAQVNDRFKRVCAVQCKLEQQLQEFEGRLEKLDCCVSEQGDSLKDLRAQLESFQEDQSKHNAVEETRVNDLQSQVVPEIYLKLDSYGEDIKQNSRQQEKRLKELTSMLGELSRTSKKLEMQSSQLETYSHSLTLDLDTRMAEIHTSLRTLHSDVIAVSSEQKSNEKRNEMLKEWVSMEIKKSSSKLELDTDIGVRCLVCNALTNQNDRPDLLNADQFKVTLHHTHAQQKTITDQLALLTHQHADSTTKKNASPSGTRRNKLVSLFGPPAALLPTDIDFVTINRTGDYQDLALQALTATPSPTTTATSTNEKFDSQPLPSATATTLTTTTTAAAINLVTGNYPAAVSGQAVSMNTLLYPPKERIYFQNLGERFPASVNRGGARRPKSSR